MSDHISITTPAQGSPSRLSWGSVIAGVVVASAVMFCLCELGMAFGLSLLKPQDPGHDAALSTIALTGAIAWVASLLVSLFIGGWAAAHLARQSNEVDSVLHGLLVWGLGIAMTVILSVTAAGLMVGGAFSLVASGMTAVGSAAGGALHGAGAAAGGIAQAPAFNWDTIKFQAQSLLKGAQAPSAGADSQAPSHATADDSLALLGRLFANPGTALTDEDRSAVVSMLAANAGLSHDEAVKQEQQWEAAAQKAARAYEERKTEMEAKARAAAASAAKTLADAAWLAFAASILAASAAMLGAYLGGYTGLRPFAIRSEPARAPAALT